MRIEVHLNWNNDKRVENLETKGSERRKPIKNSK